MDVLLFSFQGSRLMGHIAPVNSVDFASGNSDYLVTSGRDRAVKIWQWRSKTVKLNIDLRKYGRGTGLLVLTISLLKILICTCLMTYLTRMNLFFAI